MLRSPRLRGCLELPPPPEDGMFSTLRRECPQSHHPHEGDTVFEKGFYLPSPSCFLDSISISPRTYETFFRTPFDCYDDDDAWIVPKLPRPGFDQEEFYEAKRIEKASRKSKSGSVPVTPIRAFRTEVNAEALLFQTDSAAEAVRESEVVLRKYRRYCKRQHMPIKACYVAALVLQHRVITMDSSYAWQLRMRAASAAPWDVFGLWDLRRTDVVVALDLHRSRAVGLITLYYIKIDLQLIGNLWGPFKCDFFHVFDHPNVTFSPFHKINWGFEVVGVPPKTRVFKPAFAKYYFSLAGRKWRLAVEFVQTAIITLEKLIDNELSNQEYGVALYLVQLLRKSIRYFTWLLPYRPLLNSYMFATHLYQEGKCYYYLAKNWPQRETICKDFDTARSLFRPMEEMFSPFDEEFLDSQTNQNELGKSCEVTIHVPGHILNCLAAAYRGFHGIALNPAWSLSCLQKEEVTVKYFLHHTWIWKKCMAADKSPEDSATRLDQLTAIEERLEEALAETQLSPLCRVCLNLLLDRVLILSGAWRQNRSFTLSGFIHRYICCIDWNEHIYSRRNSCSRAVLVLIAEYRLALPLPTADLVPLSACIDRPSYILIVKKVLFDAVFYAVLQQNQISRKPASVYGLVELLPLVLKPWLVKGGRRGRTYSLQVPKNEKQHVDEILGMFFYGISLVYFMMNRIASQVPKTQHVIHNNALYYLGLAIQYLQHAKVATAVMKAILSFSMCQMQCLLNYNMDYQPARFSRLTAVLNCCYMLLPMAWELCILEGGPGAPAGPQGYNELVISEVTLPLPVQVMEEKYSRENCDIYNCALERVLNDLDFDGEFPLQLFSKSTESSSISPICNYVPYGEDTGVTTHDHYAFPENTTPAEDDGPHMPSKTSDGAYMRVEEHIEEAEREEQNMSRFYSAQLFEELTKHICGIDDEFICDEHASENSEEVDSNFEDHDIDESDIDEPEKDKNFSKNVLGQPEDVADQNIAFPKCSTKVDDDRVLEDAVLPFLNALCIAIKRDLKAENLEIIMKTPYHLGSDSKVKLSKVLASCKRVRKYAKCLESKSNEFLCLTLALADLEQTFNFGDITSMLRGSLKVPASFRASAG